MSSSVLIVEDDPVLGPSLLQRLVLEGFQATLAGNLKQAKAFLKKTMPDFVLSDIRLPDGSGEDLMSDLSSRLGAVPVIFMTAFGDLDQAVRLVRQGARDYIAKPFDTDALVQRISDLSTPEPTVADDTFGLSPAMKKLREMLDRLAPLDLPVLLTGETGTGKEVASRYLHNSGPRAEKAFEAINCAQLNPELADSLLFGHEKGAFTGASEKRLGIFETVGNGTLLLDEIGEMSHDLQLKFLRVLQERKFRRLGARSDTEFLGRIVCATNRNLEQAVIDGDFREDLLFRINVVTLRVPALRDRREEIVPLIRHFAKLTAEQIRVPAKRLSEAASDAALAHNWPGNVRELRNRVERAVALGMGEEIDVDDLFPDQAVTARRATVSEKTNTLDLTLEQVREMAERDHIQAVLMLNDWQMQTSAEALGISRSTLWERMQKFDIKRES
ncbi:MAG: sigma-54 dependent transcriptional regulator [Pseudomonadota bacterium]